MKNVLSIFESRINDIFAHGGAGSAPITFKKLAKRTIREMENETFVIDGVDTAPALYTVLVSADDDRVMRPFYANITAEVSSLVEAQAKKRGYTFVGQPLVRFMIDPSLKPGKYAVFAENVDPLTLARLREEENAFLGIAPQPEQTAQPAQTHSPQPAQPNEAPQPDEEDGFTIIPEDSIPLEEEGEVSDSQSQYQPESVAPETEARATTPEVPAAEEPSHEAQPAPQQDAASPQTVDGAPKRSSSLEAEPQDGPAAQQAGQSQPAAEPRRAQARQQEQGRTPSCTLTDQQTGKVYTITSERTPIGREHVPGGIVLRDPNVSRRHAELIYNGGEWHIHDLNSTNGTLVNDIDVEECTLRDGDVLTIGLLNLVFREH